MKELEDELEFRARHFKTETEKLKHENKMLKETGSISKKEANEMRDTQKALQDQINKLEQDNKDIQERLQKKEMEALQATKKLADLTDELNESKKEKMREDSKDYDSHRKISRSPSVSSKRSKKAKNSSELFLSKWENNEYNDDVRVELLNNFIHSAELRLELFKRKNEFLI